MSDRDRSMMPGVLAALGLAILLGLAGAFTLPVFACPTCPGPGPTPRIISTVGMNAVCRTCRYEYKVTLVQKLRATK